MINLLLEARKDGLKYEETQEIGNAGFATVEEPDIGKIKTTEKMKVTD